MAKRKSTVKRKASFSHRDFLMYILVFALVGAFALWVSFAAPHHGGGGSGGLSLTNESFSTSLNPTAPKDCLNEDDGHERDYSGSLSGNFSSTEQLCNGELSGGIYWDSGGIGLRSEAWVVGSMTDMTITSPTGVTHHTVLVGSGPSKGGTTYHYQTCFCPPYTISGDHGGTPLSITYSGDPWTYNLSGQFKKVTYKVIAYMIDAPQQQASCPASEQNLVP